MMLIITVIIIGIRTSLFVCKYLRYKDDNPIIAGETEIDFPRSWQCFNRIVEQSWAGVTDDRSAYEYLNLYCYLNNIHDPHPYPQNFKIFHDGESCARRNPIIAVSVGNCLLTIRLPYFPQDMVPNYVAYVDWTM